MSLFIIVKLFLYFFGQKIGSLAGLGSFQYVLVGENGQLTAIPRVEVSSSTANSNSSSRPPPLQQLQQLQQQASTQVYGHSCRTEGYPQRMEGLGGRWAGPGYSVPDPNPDPPDQDPPDPHFLGLPDPDLDPLVRYMDPDSDPDPSIIKQKIRKTSYPTVL
jgi:hypothetical protein